MPGFRLHFCTMRPRHPAPSMKTTSPLPRALYRAADTRRLDALTIERGHVAGYTLMTRAGDAAFAALRETWPQARRIAVICGLGNNAGDGFVIARLAHESGIAVRVHAVAGTDGLVGDAATAFHTLHQSGISPTPSLPAALDQAEVIVDALFGTGLDREVAGVWRATIETVNASGKPVLAVDIPSGLHADRGVVMGVAVKAALTVTFIGIKQGLLRDAGREHSGELCFADLGVPPSVYAAVTPSAVRMGPADLAALLPRRSRAAHKGWHGHVLVVGGERGMAGAVRMAGEAAARVGAGLITVATHAEHAPLLMVARPELMAYGITARADLDRALQRATVIAIGPGLGRAPWGRMLWDRALESSLPLVVDADALNLLAADPVRRDNWILTPHPGEAARLLDGAAAQVSADPFAAVAEIQRRFGGVTVLKGAGTLVCGPQPGAITLIDAGNPGMASGGMGDVLTGVVAGLLAQGLSLYDAARCGACLHAAAGDLAAREGERGLLASDLMLPLRRLANPGPGDG